MGSRFATEPITPQAREGHEVMTVDSKRSAIIYACAIGFATWIGFHARQYALRHAGSPADYAADILLALAVFAAIGLSFPAIPTWQATAGAFTLPAILKLGQLSHAPWLDPICGTPLGLLVLGTEFVATDMACYAAGAALGMMIELSLLD
jgi:hypothetical protein